jgi:phosphorylcholine metabolism protein LicD
VTQAFKKFNIEDWWLDSGSLLGYERHKGFIPHDDDIDLVVLVKKDTEKKLEKCYDYLKKKYPITFVYTPIPVCKTLRLEQNSRPILDIFLMYEKDNMIKPNDSCLMLWPNGYYHKKYTFPLKQVEFEGSTVFVPKEPLRYLKQMYSENCMNVYLMDHIHFDPFELDIVMFWKWICIWLIADIPILLNI